MLLCNANRLRHSLLGEASRVAGYRQSVTEIKCHRCPPSMQSYLNENIFAQFLVATRGRKVDGLARRDQTCCAISSILRRCAGRYRPVQRLRTRSPQSPDGHLNREGTVSLPASGSRGNLTRRASGQTSLRYLGTRTTEGRCFTVVDHIINWPLHISLME